MKLWIGRLSGELDPRAAQLNRSLPFDRRLGLEEVRGSIAWAQALERAGVLSSAEAEGLVRGLEQIAEELQTGQFPFQDEDEDIHTAVERRLTELIGPLAGKLHTGRSRNDQVATDLRLWTMGAVQRLEGHLRGVQAALLARAQADLGLVLPGYTHLQRAQPILLSHWWLAHVWALQRDRERLQEVRRRAGVCPLGSGALAGTSFPIDRVALARELGMEWGSPNSLDAVSDRDFVAELLFCAVLIGLHLGRLAEALIVYSTAEFGFLELADAYTTGSSLMPHKKNPDLLELIRAKSGRLIGLLTGLLATLKALPSAYDKDLQEDKPPLFEAVDTLELVLPVMEGILTTLRVNPDRMRAAVEGELLSTDLVDVLVERGVPFREAYRAVGEAVRRALEQGTSLLELPRSEWNGIHPALSEAPPVTLDVNSSLAKRAALGGTAPERVREQIEQAKRLLQTSSQGGNP